MPDYPFRRDAHEATVKSLIWKRGSYLADERTGKAALENPEREVDEVALAERLDQWIALENSQFVMLADHLADLRLPVSHSVFC